ncbi:probable serine/threonine-protein kinase DDB_G0271682 [Stylophora pistillata]|nr:probable serine/threonine-protein kinase DDB_G0271682 [Stylophora pistillata]
MAFCFFACEIKGLLLFSFPQGKIGESTQQLENIREELRERDGQLSEMTQQLTNVEGQLVERDNQLREKTQQLTNVQGQLRERDGQLMERTQQLANVRGQLVESDGRLAEMIQEYTNVEDQLREGREQLRQMTEHSTKVEEQLREKKEQVRQLAQQLKHVQRQSQDVDRQLRENNRQLREMTEQMANDRQQIQQLENIREKRREREGQLREMTQQLIIIREQLQEKDGEVNSLEGRLRAKEQEKNELENTLLTVQQALSESSRQQMPDWIIQRDQIQLTDNELGKGAWGRVVEGKYCGCAVAVKQMHHVLRSSLYRREPFEREMNIASRCRHPCLLQFIGATNDDGSPLFVTELMEKSLRNLLDERPLSSTEVSVISLDVARALNYLHKKKPCPIIHRDISSANVLLWRHTDQWRGKVSDYGTANFMQQSMSVGPGAIIYSAPEAFTEHQTVKVDVYSFGVLLWEICIRRQPSRERREKQVAMVTDRVLRVLIRRCLQEDPEARPSMEEILSELEKLI